MTKEQWWKPVHEEYLSQEEIEKLLRGSYNMKKEECQNCKHFIKVDIGKDFMVVRCDEYSEPLKFPHGAVATCRKFEEPDPTLQELKEEINKLKKEVDTLKKKKCDHHDHHHHSYCCHDCGTCRCRCNYYCSPYWQSYPYNTTTPAIVEPSPKITWSTSNGSTITNSYTCNCK